LTKDLFVLYKPVVLTANGTTLSCLLGKVSKLRFKGRDAIQFGRETGAFRLGFSLHLQGRKLGTADNYLEKLIIINQNAGRRIPEDKNVCSDHRDNPETHVTCTSPYSFEATSGPAVLRFCSRDLAYRHQRSRWKGNEASSSVR
jgi:hypothetical protein